MFLMLSNWSDTQTVVVVLNKSLKEFLPEPIEMTENPATFDTNILKNLRQDRTQLPVGVENILIFSLNFHVESDGTVRRFDTFRCDNNI